MITFSIPGPPQGKGRPKFGKGIVYTPVKTVTYEKLIQYFAYQAMKGKDILDCPVSANLNIYMPIPKSWSLKKNTLAMNGDIRPTIKPDIDNIIKVVFDAINKIVWMDDKQVVYSSVKKEYSNKPRILVQIRNIF